MKINKPLELFNKEVYDKNGAAIGFIDKIWKSWNQDNPGYFLGIRTNDNAKNRYFRGSNKLVPIHGEYIDYIREHIRLNITLDYLYHFWNKTFRCGNALCSTNDLIEKTVYDKKQSRIGVFFTTLENPGPSSHFGIYIDPYLCESWNSLNNTLMPIPSNFITRIEDTITVDKTVEELKNYWKEHFYF